jgi:type II secretory pathway pseudopilin PulG
MTQKKFNMRTGFSMLTAIFLIVIMSTIGALVLNLSANIVQETGTQYRKEQAILYAKSYTEFAIMAATAQNCIKSINANVDGNAAEVKAGQGYRVEVDVQYIGSNSDCNTSSITYVPSQHNIILIDTYVRYRNPDVDSSLLSDTWTNYKGITYHRRTLQRL